MSLNKEVGLDDVMQIIAEKLEAGGSVTFNPKGTSMLPMLRDGDDTVVLSKPKGRLHLFDLPLYRRKDGSYVLHRVVNFGSDGSYTMCGDNQFAVEKGITDDNVIGVVTAFYRKGKRSDNADSVSERLRNTQSGLSHDFIDKGYENNFKCYG